MIEHLRRLKVEVTAAHSSFNPNTAHSYETKNAPMQAKTFPAGSYIIDLNQPQKRLIKAFLEQDTPQDKAFVDDNMARFSRNQMRGAGQFKEDYGFYDITAWSLPLAFGIEAFWTEDAGNQTNSTTVTAEYLEKQKRGSVSGRAKVAYLIPYESDGSGLMVLRLLQEGFRVGVASRTMNAGGRNWKAGTFVVRISRNPEQIHEAINQLSQFYGAHITAVNSGYSEEGDTPIGGEAIYQMQSGLKIAMIGDEGIDQTSYGSIWWNLDRYGIKFTPITFNTVKGGGLKGYNILIMPDGGAGRYSSSLGANGIETLKDWISNGGTLITIRGASVFTTLKNVGLTSAKMVGSGEDDEKGNVSAEPQPIADSTPNDKN